MGVHEISDDTIRYYVYYLAELNMDPNMNIYDGLLIKRRRVLSSFENMRDRIKDSFIYNLEKRLKYDAKEGAASPFCPF